MNKASKPVALVTGVSSGIGLATAEIFSKNGWIVVGTIRDAPSATLRRLRVDLQPAEMSRQTDLERVVTTAWRTYGRLDALVCNAGYGLIGPIDTFDYNQMKDQLTINTLAPAELIRLTVPLMKQQRSGVIVAVSSVVGRTGLPGYSVYAASKHALEGLLESLAMELEPAGIRCCLIEPSGVNTNFWTSLRRGGRRAWQDKELGGRLGSEPAKAHHGLTSEQVAAQIYRATMARGGRLRYPLGQARLVEIGKRLLPDNIYRAILKRALK